MTGVLSGYAQQSSPPNLAVIAGGSSYTSQLRMNLRTTMKVTVLDASNNPISGATVSATGVHLRFADGRRNGQATSNDMGAIGTNKTLHRDSRQDGLRVATRARSR